MDLSAALTAKEAETKLDEIQAAAAAAAEAAAAAAASGSSCQDAGDGSWEDSTRSG